MKPDHGRLEDGFTLVEVLVALAIVAFGLIAVFGQLNQSAAAADRLRDKTFAHWLAMNLLTERRLLQQAPGDGSESDEIEMANTRWHYQIRYSETDVEGLRRADVTVSYADDPDRAVYTAIGFIGERPASPPDAAGAGGWAPIDANAQIAAGAQDQPPAGAPATTPRTPPPAQPSPTEAAQ